MPVPASEPSTELTLAQARIAALEAELQAARAERDQAAAEAAAEHQRLTAERDTLREAYTAVKLELELLKKRLFVAKAERVDVAQLELEFAAKLAELDALAKRLEPMPESVMPSFPGGAAKGPKRPPGRRDFSEVDLPEESVVLVDAALEGKVPRSGFEVSYQLKWRRGSMVRLKVMRAKYREVVEGVDGEKTHTAERPPEILPRSLATPSLVARLAIEKYLNGMPLHRLEAAWLRDGITIDRGTMSRWLGDVGALLRDTVVAVAKQYAVRTSFCCSTDATGVHVQPLKGDMKKKQPCRRGHFFVQLFDKAHAFFEYVPRETSDAVKELMAGFRGYVQADAKSVYDVLYRASDGDEDDECDGTCIEVGCWAHARRKYWEAAIAGSEVAREALLRIQRIFEADEKLKGLEPDVRKRLRDERVRPYVEAFFEWARPEHQKVKGGEWAALVGARLLHQPGGCAQALPRRWPAVARQQRLGARAAHHRHGSQGVALRRQRRRGAVGRRLLQPHRVVQAARPRARGLPARLAARPAALDEGQAPQAGTAQLRCHARSPRDRREPQLAIKHRSVQRYL